MAQTQTPSPRRPQPEDYGSAAEFRWARRNWRRSHGGGLFGLLLIAFVCGSLAGSTTAVFALMAFAVVCWLIARSRP
jgi:hypothetical protein